jgi:hypothetical protein
VDDQHRKNSGMVGPAGHTQVNDFNSLQKGGDQKAALKPLGFLTRGHDRPNVVLHSYRVAPFIFSTSQIACTTR